MSLFSTLYARLAAVFLLLVIALGVVLLYLSQLMSEMYSQEIMQRLNQSVAMYIAGQDQLIERGQVDEAVVDALAERAMILNPSLELYILDAEGTILSHRLPVDATALDAVSLPPIASYLGGATPLPILGDDPRDPSRLNVFSAWPIEERGTTVGFVYAIVGGQMYKALRAAVTDSYVMRVSLLLMLGSMLAAALAGCVVFFFMTRRLTRLRRQLGRYEPGEPSALSGSGDQTSPERGDEIDQLGQAFGKMVNHIDAQFETLRSMDETRRELVANVSHDLRTPLAAMQGYLETLLIRNDSLSELQRRDYLNTAFRHSQRLGKLVGELFELAKLESNGVQPALESFSLLELVHDSVQEFQLVAQGHEVTLEVVSGESDCFVIADIALMQRVLQNLLDNALRHTPAGGRVQVCVSRKAHSALVEINDNGKGIQSHEIPFIFDRFYRSKQQQPSDKIGTGLGLAIVKRILDLHQSHIDVRSQLNRGTTFYFELPVPEPAAV